MNKNLPQRRVVVECRKRRTFIHREALVERSTTPTSHVRYFKDVLAKRRTHMGPCPAQFTALAEIAAAYLGYVVVVDEKGLEHELVFNLIAQAPVMTVTTLTRRWAQMLDEIQVGLESEFVPKEVAHQVLTMSWAEQTRTLKADLKTAAKRAARWATLTIDRANRELSEPTPSQFLDVPQKEADKQARIAALDVARTQAKAADDTARADFYGKQLRDARREQIVDYTTAHAHWKSQLDAIDRELARLAGAPEREVAVREQLAAHFAAEPKAPVAPTLLYRGVPFAKIEKSRARAEVPATVVTLGSNLLRELRKERDSIVQVLQPDDRTAGAARSPICVLGAMPMSGSDRMVSFDETDAEWLSYFNFVADEPNLANEADHAPDDADAEQQFEQSLMDVMREKLANSAAKTKLTLSPDAAQKKAIFCEHVRAARMDIRYHPILDAYLARVPITLCVLAALLHLAMGETGPISMAVMSEAIGLCNMLISEFERAVVPAPEMSAEEKARSRVRDALSGYVEKQIRSGAAQPFRIAMRTFCKESGSIGLPKAAIRRTAYAMQELDWVRIVPDGLDQVIEMNPYIFGPMHRS
uniref:DUF3987 domain-containing protein n=1 Tax=Burkholderia diffusa TaxID=488732 RepID=UPI001CC7D6FC|nr:DUF3987 domain-containing protein [Burkholderia diffusa]